ncbi:hypothetical protein J4227_07995 [Candidatus Woesearchaeota archaeon]|nr:hypothetical protein [Candidatus Woesearchaeota archaeon]
MKLSLAPPRDRAFLPLPALVAVVLFFTLFAFAFKVMAVPEGPTISYLSNQTGTPDSASIINTTGGSITTVTLNATTQNTRWKAYVGNVTGTLTLEDGTGATIYDWITNSPSGEVYATRKSSTVSWGNIACASLANMENENQAINHTQSVDNISTTFSQQEHGSFYVGTNYIGNNTCYSVHTYVNSSAQSSLFEEVVLYDGTTPANGDIVFASILEDDVFGYNNQTYDFQLIVPENGLPGYASSTAYYFYVEIS